VQLRRGDVHRHTNYLQREGAANYRLIVSSAPVAADDELAVVLSLHVYDTDKGGLLSVRRGEVGYASAMNIETTIRSRLSERVHACTADELESIDAALRAALFDG
jgi:hypothetical protein